MPDVIDNVKVGEHIRKLLKKKNMTQDDLAHVLSISKSAVSQNLRGKSSFDIQNLIRIAALFEITLDQLLTLSTPTEKRPMSDYERLVTEGLDVISGLDVTNMRLKNPDMYGKPLIEYVIEKRDVELFGFLHEQEVDLVDQADHRAPEVLLMMILFMLENTMEDVIRYVRFYTEIKGTFLIEDKGMRMMIWGLFDRPENKADLVDLLTYKPPFKSAFKSFSKKQGWSPVSRTDLLSTIAEFKLTHVLKTVLELNSRNDDFLRVMKTFVGHEYLEGISVYVNTLFKSSPNWVEKTALDVQKAFIMMINVDDLGLVSLFVEKELYLDLTAGVIEAIERGKDRLSSMLLARFKDVINLRKIGEICITHDRKDMLDDLMEQYMQDDLDYLLSYVDWNAHDMMVYLVRHGARFSEKYYNLQTFKKVNLMIDHIRQGENES